MKIINKIIRICVLSILFIVGVALIVFGFTKSYIYLKYQEDNSLNYKVYLKNNSYFDSNYLDENRTYITSLIDYIKVNYHYNLKFNKKVDGNYTYKVDAVIYANKPNGEEGYYWTKRYNIVEPTVKNINDKKNITIDEVIDVDYNKYNNILEDFKKEYSISTDGLLAVELTVKSNVTGEEFTDSINVPSTLSLSVPLLEKAVEASISKSAISNDNTLTIENDKLNDYKYGSIILGILLILIDLILIICIIIFRIQNKNKHLYLATLKKIVDTHDSIIANVDNLPDVRDLKVINVSSFSELLDVYNEVRMPINFYENRRHDKAIFMLINNNMCWKYVLDKYNIESIDK